MTVSYATIGFGGTAAALAGGASSRGYARETDDAATREAKQADLGAAEMAEVARARVALGTDAAMTRGTVARQRAFDGLGLAPPETLSAKIAALAAREQERRAA